MRLFRSVVGAALLLCVPVALFFVIRERQSWRPRVLGQMKHFVTALAWSSDSKWLASGEAIYSGQKKDGEIRLWSVRDGESQVVQPEQNDGVQSLQFLQGNQKIASRGYGYPFRVHTLHDGPSEDLKVIKPWRIWKISPNGHKIVCQENFDVQTNLVLRDLANGNVTALRVCIQIQR